MKNIFKVLLVGLFLVTTACGTTEEKKDDKASSNDENFPVVVEHAYGKTTIESKPKRVVAIGWSNQDVALALDVKPVAVPKETYGNEKGEDLLPWSLEKIKELGADPEIIDLSKIDFEAISAAEPDVILAANSGITENEYKKLSKIAPTIAFPDQPWQVAWRDTILMNSKALGYEEEGKALVKDLEKQIDDAMSEYPDVKGKSAVFLAFGENDLSKTYYYSKGDSRADFLLDLGLTMPESIKKLSEEANSFYGEISAENAELLNDVDIIVMYGTEDTLKALQADPLFGKVNAIKNGSVVLLGEATPLAAAMSPSALSIPYVLDDISKLLGEAAQKVK